MRKLVYKKQIAKGQGKLEAYRRKLITLRAQAQHALKEKQSGLSNFP